MVTSRMIGKLRGVIDSYGEDFIVLDVNGVGYQVFCSARTLQALAAPGEAATLSIETYVREDQIKLFGFQTDVEREWFRLLQTVQGVGARVALSVLGTLKPADLATAVAMRDKAAITRRRGVGPKVAERIVTELKDKAPAYVDLDPAVVRIAGSLDEKRAPQPIADAVSALVNLGYGQPQAAAAIATASRAAGEGADTRRLHPPRAEGAVAMSIGYELKRIGRSIGIMAIFTIVGPLIVTALFGVLLLTIGIPILELILEFVQLEALRPWLSIAAVLLVFFALVATVPPSLLAGFAFALLAVYAGMNSLWTALVIVAIMVLGVVILGSFASPSENSPLLLPSVQGLRQGAWLALFLVVPAAIAASLCWLDQQAVASHAMTTSPRLMTRAPRG